MPAPTVVHRNAACPFVETVELVRECADAQSLPAALFYRILFDGKHPKMLTDARPDGSLAVDAWHDYTDPLLAMSRVEFPPPGGPGEWIVSKCKRHIWVVWLADAPPPPTGL